MSADGDDTAVGINHEPRLLSLGCITLPPREGVYFNVIVHDQVSEWDV